MSKIEVNTVDAQCGSTITVGSSGKNVKIEGNDIRSNDYKASDAGNIISQSGTTITIGASGDTVSLASGASQSGFGRTGTVNWNTTVITSTPTTGVNGVGYFINSSGGAKTINLPASPSAGDIMAVSDYAQSSETNNITIGRNGSNIQGDASDLVIANNGFAFTLVFVDATKGWVVTDTGAESDKTAPPSFICASVSGSGNTLVTAPDCANAKIATFTGPGSFTVNSISNGAGNNVISHMVVAGGGGGGGGVGGGGGAGGFREVNSPSAPFSASPLDGYPNAPNRITVTATSFPITVGAGGPGGAPGSETGNTGSNSIFSTITSAGGGGGARSAAAGNGGSGGGGYIPDNPTYATGSGNTPPTTPSQGNNGGNGNPGPSGGEGGGGGGGATQVGGNSSGGGNPNTGGPGGNGATNSITGSPVVRAGGGGGSGFNGTGGAGGSGGGGDSGPGRSQGAGVAAPVNSGSGGGAGNFPAPNSTIGGNGGSGIVIIRYKFQ